ncbi:hypothetical protein CLV90_2444 [Maribacter spongiicola]|uniref:Uncharacterized protein n=1 Tax=Maribacter spongiicola TaxID=1206753 RepID=A0A4R7K579_9FLAO|nr:hypothetical protein [Maribacter spongiicola]TDT45357.1 hypothetical protein CLV90_2444 [Maribacter spongiicola]
MKISMSAQKIAVLSELERKRKSVEQLLLKLESYLYEPQTHSGFEKKEILKSTINRIAISTSSLLSILKMNDISIMDSMNDVERQMEECYELELEVASYMLNR